MPMQVVYVDRSVDVLAPDEGGHRWITVGEQYADLFPDQPDEPHDFDGNVAMFEERNYHDGPRCHSCGLHFCRNCDPGQWMSVCPVDNHAD